MIPETTVPVVSPYTASACDRKLFPKLCWGAILGGTVAAIGIHILLTALGVGGGLATFSPTTDTDPTSHFSTGAAVIWSVCALIALAFGGLIAGRFSHSLHGGFVHGVLVWSLTLIITLLLLSTGTGMILGGAMKVLGQGLGIGVQAAASGTGDLVKEGVQRSKDQVSSFIDEASQSVSTNGAPGASIRSKRDIGFAVTKLFAPENDITSQDNRQAVIKALSANGQMSEADATKTVDEWIAAYKDLKAELDHAKTVAEQKAKEIADQAAKNVSCAAIWAFFALLVGLLVTACAGRCGAHYGLKHNERLLSADKRTTV
ncbi:MAG TPA: hypothetical protein VG347_16345 [Verrucomicrobiae bacterium]|nr:hypothetical protein [Verrucomicrobiae bacterium]